MTATTGLAILGALFAALVVAGAAAVYFRSGSMAGLRQDNTDLRQRSENNRTAWQEEREKRIGLERDVAELRESNKRKDAALVRIGEQALGTADIRDLADAVRDLAELGGKHDVEAERRHLGTNESLQSVVRAIVSMRDAVEGRRDPKPPEVPQ